MADQQRRLIRIVKALGLNPDHVKAGSLKLAPDNEGWVLEWSGFAFLPAEALAQIATGDVAATQAEGDALAAALASIESQHDGVETHD